MPRSEPRQPAAPLPEGVEHQMLSLCNRLESSLAPEGVFQAVDSIPLPVAVIGAADGRVLYANHSLEELFGVSRQRLLSRSLEYLIPRLTDRRLLAKVAAAEGRVRGLELRGRHRSGAILWLSIWQNRLQHQGAECLLMVLIDVTQERLAGKRLEEQQDAMRQLLQSSDRDRELIACDIHDGVIQDMTAALMHLEAAGKAIQSGKPGATDQLKRVVNLLRGGINEARRLIDGVRAPDLDQVGLVGAIQILVDRIAKSKGIDVQFEHRVKPERLLPETETTIYRIIQECLNNIWRHSKSPQARVELIQTERVIRITVRDWGVGFEPEHVDASRFGLAGVRQRARLLNGFVQIRSVRGKGCTVRVTLPLGGSTSPPGFAV